MLQSYDLGGALRHFRDPSNQGLIEGDLFWSLAKKPPASYDDLLERAEKYINVEEAQRVRKTELDSA